MVIMRFVSWSGDGIEKFMWGREALAWSVAVRRVKSPVQQSTKVKDQCYGVTLSGKAVFTFCETACRYIYWLLYLAQIIANTLVDLNVI